MDYDLERAIIQSERNHLQSQSHQRVRNITKIDYRRMAYCAIRTRIDEYRELGIDVSIETIVTSEGDISKSTYYEWHKLYGNLYEKLKNCDEIPIKFDYRTAIRNFFRTFASKFQN